MARSRASMVLVVALSLLSGCGSDSSEKGSASPEEDAGKSSDNNGASNNGGDTGGDNNSGSDGGGSSMATQRVALTDVPNCAEDNPMTPGSECAGIVSCGGSQETPHACPSETHSCCVSGVPQESTVNCYEGTGRCRGIEATNSCDGPEDCKTGHICCVGALPNPTTRCDAPSACNTGAGESIFCHSDKDCPAGKSCKAPSMASFWAFCG